MESGVSPTSITQVTWPASVEVMKDPGAGYEDATPSTTLSPLSQRCLSSCHALFCIVSNNASLVHLSKTKFLSKLD